jgi:hypothetical protein
MKMMKTFYAGAALMVAAAMTVPAAAQEIPTKNGSVWVASRIDTLPGQMPAYLDYLATEWKKQNEFLKAEGVLLSYRVLRTNHARNGEPDLILLLEYKDNYSIAQQEAMTKKLEAAMRRDARQGAAGNLEREKIRALMGSTEYQELILK